MAATQRSDGRRGERELQAEAPPASRRAPARSVSRRCRPCSGRRAAVPAVRRPGPRGSGCSSRRSPGPLPWNSWAATNTGSAVADRAAARSPTASARTRRAMRRPVRAASRAATAGSAASRAARPPTSRRGNRLRPRRSRRPAQGGGWRRSPRRARPRTRRRRPSEMTRSQPGDSSDALRGRGPWPRTDSAAPGRGSQRRATRQRPSPSLGTRGRAISGRWAHVPAARGPKT